MSSQVIVTETVKAAPPVVVTGVSLAGIAIADWVAVLTIIYLVAQLGLLYPKYRDWFRGKKNEHSG
jgi:hypothetical protein